MKSKIAIKSIVLAMLILLSILQIEKLWFENSSSHGFFTYIPQKQKEVLALQELILEPEYIAVYQAKNKGEYFMLDSAGILFNAVLKDGGKLIRRLPQMQTTAYQYLDLFEKPHILCQFAVPITSRIIEQIAQKNSGSALAIKSMVIVPADLEESYFRLLFFNEDLTQMLGFAISKSEMQDENEVFAQYISNQAMVGDNLLLSSKQQELPGFVGEVLLPSQNQNYILPQEWSQELAFIDSGSAGEKIDKDKLAEYLFAYVKNPNILWNILEEERVRYGDSSVLLEYNSRGRLRYQFIQALPEESENLPAGEALTRALDFLKKDSLLSNQEIRLADYSHANNQHHFYFNYYFRGHPLVWGKDYVENYQMEYPMEVVVEKEKVVLYQRILLQSDYLLQQGSRFKVNYQEALNQFYQKQHRDKVKSLYLGYFVEQNQIQLGWVVETEKEQFLYPLHSEVARNELE